MIRTSQGDLYRCERNRTYCISFSGNITSLFERHSRWNILVSLQSFDLVGERVVDIRLFGHEHKGHSQRRMAGSAEEFVRFANHVFGDEVWVEAELAAADAGKG